MRFSTPLFRFAALGTVTLLLANAARAQTVYALLQSTDVPVATLASFDAASPTTLTRHALISGVTGYPVAIETRPATGQLYLLSYANFTVRLYVLNPATSLATLVGPALPLNLGNSSSAIGFGFDPVTDQVRVMGNNAANYRLDPATGALLAADAPLAYASTDANAGQTPNVDAIAYSNAYHGSSTTVMYGLDKGAGRLVASSQPNAGTLRTVGPVGNGLTSSYSCFGVDYDPVAGRNTLYLVRTAQMSPALFDMFLYTLNPATGTGTLVGQVGTSTFYSVMADIAVARPLVSATRARAEAAADVHLYPNPATGSRSLAFTLSRSGRVTLDLFDSLGRLLGSQAVGVLPAGPHTLPWTPAVTNPGLHTLRLSVDGQPQAAVSLQGAD